MNDTEPRSRQLAQYYALKDSGKCVKCWKPADGRHYCEACREKYTERQRAKRGYQKWEKGKPGRPPIKSNT